VRSLMLLLVFLAGALPAYSQLIPGGPSDDFRSTDHRSGSATTGPAGPSLPTSPTIHLDKPEVKSPDEVLKGIDKDLGRSTLERSGDSGSSNLERDLRSRSDMFR
jgi:hypothetical protein